MTDGRTRSGTARGFTLLEVTVTVVLIGILVGVGFAGWSWVTGYGKTSSATTLLERVTIAETTYASAYGKYTEDGTSPALTSVTATGIVLTTTAEATDPGIVSLAVASDGTLGLATPSPSGCLWRTVSSLASGATISHPHPASETCTGQAALDAR